MHEASIIEYTLKAVETAAIKNNVTEVGEITLRIGKLRMIVPQALERTFSLLTGDPPFCNTRLVIEEVPVQIRCHDCGCSSILDVYDCDICPCCQSPKIRVTGGDELSILRFTAR